MSTIELRKELHEFIETADQQFLNTLYETAQSYLEKKKLDKMIADGEADIESGNVHTQTEVQKMIESWTEK
jgi:predicted transcriptional regulator